MNCLQNEDGSMAPHQKKNDKHELAVNDIPKNLFSIPYYQRGYRWTEKEVTALLDDLLAFAHSETSEEVYCLQPLVLQETADGINVVDGQQRLTTIAIILRTLGVEPVWDIKYTCEKGQQLSDLIKPDKKIESINDFFRKNAREAVEDWLKQDPSRKDTLCDLLKGTGIKKVVFLLHEPSGEDGHTVFQRMNAGKTPLTSSELIRALYMEAGNGLSDSDKTDIAKEWDLIESAMTDEQFWAIWNNRDFRDVPTRMDFLFSIIADVDSKQTRHDGLLIYRKIEDMTNEKGLVATWEETLRCWWWMQSCFSDSEAFHLLGWLAFFTDGGTRGIWKEWQKAGARLDMFKKELRRLVGINFKEKEFNSFRYDSASPNELRGLFVLLNALDAQQRHIRFRFDEYRKGSWDIEHIASQTDNPLTDKEDQEEWLKLAKAEMTDEEVHLFESLEKGMSFKEKWDYIIKLFEKTDDTIPDKDKAIIGNLALLDSKTNRSYKNAIFPAKRRTILTESQNYIPPATEAAFAKLYSSSAVQMRYWSASDAKSYSEAMEKMFNDFMEKSK